MKTISKVIASIILISTLLNCVGDKDTAENANDERSIFPKGQLGPATNFTGNAYNFGLVSNDSTYNTLVGNVYFE
ncbi:MAG: cupin domain-containing protein, partial [Chryseosolibacter sp.]